MENAIQNRVNRDMAEGVLAIRRNGEVMYVNQAARTLLAVPDLNTGDKYRDIFRNDLRDGNEAFVQCLLDAVLSKTETHNNRVEYVDSDGNRHYFSITSSFLFDEEEKINEGVVLCLSDITDEVLNEKKARDSTVFFVLTMAAINLWVIFYSALTWFHIEINDFLISQLENVAALITCIFVIKYTSLTLEDIGLSLNLNKKYILDDSLFTAAILLILVITKWFAGYTTPFLHFEQLNISDVFYPATVFFQEVLARSIIYESIYRVVQIRGRKFIAIATSSLYFGALHIHKGLPYMLGATILMALSGLIYDRQRNIWGLCIPHYVLGTAFILLYGYS